MGGRGSSSGGRFGLGTTSAGNSRRPATGPNSRAAQFRSMRDSLGSRWARQRVPGSLGAAAYRPDVIKNMGAKVNDVIKGLIGR